MMAATDAMSKLFPSRGSLAVFVSYMLMFVAQGMLVTASRHGAASYSYNTVTVVLFTELLKLGGSVVVSPLGLRLLNSMGVLDRGKRGRMFCQRLVLGSPHCLGHPRVKLVV